MEKLVYVLWRRPDEPVDALSQRLLGDVAPRLCELGGSKVRVFVEDPAGAAFRVGAHPDGGLLASTVSFWLDSIDRRAALEDAIVGGAGCTTAGYLVTESVPLDYVDRTWPDGERSPGVSLVTVFDKAPGVSDDDFYREWHGTHTPMSFEIHPLWLYIRNAVARSLTPDAPTFRGIVEEAVPALDDLLDFDRFFGGNGDRARTKANIERSTSHLSRFADMAGLQTCAMAEHIITS